MSVSPSIYNYRQALDVALHTLIITYAAPAINTALSQQMTSTDSTKIPQFSDTNVITGDLLSVSEPVLCIIDAGEDDDFFASQTYNSWLATQIQIKTPWAADNVPEDFAIFFKIIVDNLRDLLNSPRGLTLTPKNPNTNTNLLPYGQSFQNCHMTGYRPMAFPNYTADKLTRCRGIVISHTAMVDYALHRQQPLGG